MQRIFNCDKMQDSSLTSDKVLNTLIYRSPFCVIIYRNYKLSKIVQFFGPPCILSQDDSFFIPYNCTLPGIVRILWGRRQLGPAEHLQWCSPREFQLGPVVRVWSSVVWRCVLQYRRRRRHVAVTAEVGASRQVAVPWTSDVRGRGDKIQGHRTTAESSTDLAGYMLLGYLI